jgi:hypothetical protein
MVHQPVLLDVNAELSRPFKRLHDLTGLEQAAVV